MRFRLIYDGELKSRQKDPSDGKWDRMAGHTQSIRKVFHRQLKHLWQNNKFLREFAMHPAAFGNPNWARAPGEDAVWGIARDEKWLLSEVVAYNFRESGYRFVPLINEQFSLVCSLDILFLRRDIPGSVISAGDLDNRIKTLIDALRKPQGANELRGNETPGDGEDPFYCLLSDDKLVSQLRVETDTLLDPPTGDKEVDRRQVRLVITVEVKPYDITSFNLSFA
jgi:hypothetical protein